MTAEGALVLAGPPCAGKSSVARLLTSNGAGRRRTLLEVDALFDLLLPASDRNREDRMLAYDAAHQLARLLLDRGRTPVLECTYSRSEQRHSLVHAVAGHPAALRVVELRVAPEDAVERFRRREQDTDLDETLVRERAEAFPYSDQALVVESTGAAPHELAGRIEAWLATSPAPARPGLWAATGLGWG